MVDCPTCEGDKAIHHNDGGHACTDCNATGKVATKQAQDSRLQKILNESAIGPMSIDEFQKLWDQYVR